MELKDHILEMIRRSSTDLSPDVESAITKARDLETEGSPARNALDTIIENIALARKQSTPICQDTGALLFYIDYPTKYTEKYFSEHVEEAVKQATALQYLRPNAVDPITGKNSGNNVGRNAPFIHFRQWDDDYIRIRFMQKGGGSENCSTQYRLPDLRIGAGRDLEGIRRCIVDAVYNAQGFGCAPGILGVGIGGDRAISHLLAKEQLFRQIGERSTIPEVAQLEIDVLKEINGLGIGAMGFGGKTSILEVLIGSQHRHPATFYVSIAYMCWAHRKKTIIIKDGEVSYS